MREIAIVSKNRILARLAELEAVSAGAMASAFESLPKNIAEYDILILDVDTVPLSASLGSCELIAVSSAGEDNSDHPNALRYPFLLGDLRARILKDTDRMSVRKTTKPTAIIYADRERRTVELSGAKLTLSDYEFRTLARLCETPDVAVSRAELSALFDSDTDGNMADVYICRLRKKFSEVCDGIVILTVRGKGYMTSYKMV